MGYKWAKTIMKKITLVAIALVCSVAFTNCAAKKPVKPAEPAPAPQPIVQEKTPEELELEQLEHQLKVIEMKNKIAQAEAEARINDMNAANAQHAIALRLGQKIHMPCIEESYDKPGEYMAGLGIAENEEERGPGIANANRYAIADISSKYIGMIKNGVSQYAKNVKTRSGQLIKENEMEGAAEAIGTKLIDKYANAVCRDAEWDINGKYTCYVAVHVPLREVLNETIDELGVIQTDLDRQKFREYMQSELDRQAAAAQAEKEEVIKMRQNAGL